ncbi:MAG: cobalamin biosynthesis protein CobD [Deltaproteobacteria bacterium]|nr:cobalamin biosynthesis protein CobD [Deltaproteobacteria bacterium]
MTFLNPPALYTIPVIIISAYLMDLILGDPKWFPHPVKWIGRYIIFFEDKIRKIIENPAFATLYQRGDNWKIEAERVGGIFLFIVVAGTVYGLTWFFLYISHLTSHTLYLLLVIFIAYITLSVKSLHQEAYSVLSAMNKISIDEARKRLSNIVGRDTQNLSEGEIYRAVVETVAENTSDGIIAPLFYLAIGGPALALAYKAVNTLDSMVGYKNETYKNFGWFSARMDDIANFIPARVTAVLMVIACFILNFDWKNSLNIIWRDARNHPSPNAGYPEAAVAGALGLQLGGLNYYFGMPHNRPVIGDNNNNFTMESVKNTVKIMHLAAFTGVILFSSLLLPFSIW